MTTNPTFRSLRSPGRRARPATVLRSASLLLAAVLAPLGAPALAAQSPSKTGPFPVGRSLGVPEFDAERFPDRLYPMGGAFRPDGTLAPRALARIACATKEASPGARSS